MIPTRIGQVFENMFFAGFLVVSKQIKTVLVSRNDILVSGVHVPCVSNATPEIDPIDSTVSNSTPTVANYKQLIGAKQNIPSLIELDLCWLTLTPTPKMVLHAATRFIPSHSKTEVVQPTVVLPFLENCKFKKQWYVSSSTLPPEPGWRSLTAVSFTTGAKSDMFLLPVTEYYVRQTITLNTF